MLYGLTIYLVNNLLQFIYFFSAPNFKLYKGLSTVYSQKLSNKTFKNQALINLPQKFFEPLNIQYNVKIFTLLLRALMYIINIKRVRQ